MKILIRITYICFALFVLLLAVAAINGQKVGCGNDYNTTKWNCDKLLHYFSPSNLEKTLYCIGYNKLLAANLEEVTNDTMPYIFIEIMINSLEKVDEENNLITLVEDFVFYYDTKMIEIQINDCETSYIDIPTNFISNFIPSSFLGYGMEYEDIQEMLLEPSSGAIVLEETRVTKEPCRIDLKSYPFDMHDCEVKLTIELPTKYVELGSNESPVESENSLLNPGWTVAASNISIKQTNDTDGWFYYTWSFNLKFKRNIESIIMHFYLPSFILCFVSMASLFIHQDLLPARMCLCVTTCLSLITLIIGAK